MASQTSADQRVFMRSAIRHLPNHVLLRLTPRSAPRTVMNRLLKYSEKHLSKAGLLPFSEADKQAYEAQVAATKLWHGTGRFQYVDGQVKDIFDQIVRQGSLRPVNDHYAIVLGGQETVTVSTTPLRMIARSYADMHGLGEHEPHRYGSSLFWVSYYYGYFYARLFTRHGLTVFRNYKRWNTTTAAATGERAWGKKVNQHASYVWDVFGLGSDIVDNYPILFGISRPRTIANIPSLMAQTEVRLSDSIHFAELSHIEVPVAYIADVTKMLRRCGYSTPVMALELGETVASRYSIAELLAIGTNTVYPQN